MARSRTTLTFYGGIGEIGGNKILLEDRKTKIFLDFGQSFTMGADYFAGWLTPRGINGLGDYFEFNLLPKIKGIYSEKQLRFTDLPYSSPQINAVFLSHAHIDHLGHIGFLDEKIPVHCGYGTRIFIKSIEKTSPANFGEHSYTTFRTGDQIRIGHLLIEPIHVDHSIPAAYGFIIHTFQGAVVYTGDLRAHGPRKEMTAEFADRARKSEPIAMISEGTRMAETERRKNYSESEVRKLSDEIVSATKKIVFITRYGRDTDRFRTFYSVAKKNDRKLVITPKTAYLLSRLVEDKRLDLPDPMKDETILVYYKRKRTGDYVEKDYYVWEREFIEKMVNHEFVHKHQPEIIMDLDFFQFAELIDIKPDPGSHFIHSMSEPFSEEDIEDRIMHNWLNHFKIKFHQLHASGHLDKRQLAELISHIKPKKIFPIHTENPRLFSRINKNVQLPKHGKRFMI